MNELPSNATQRSNRSKALRIALATFIGAYVCVFAGSTVFGLAKQVGNWFMCLGNGALYVAYTSHAYSTTFEDWSLRRTSRIPVLTRWPRYWEYSAQDGQLALSLLIPLWLPLLPFLLLAALLVYRDRTRRPPGRCRHCGYNLTGNTSGRCPECGNPTGTGAPVVSGLSAKS